MDPGTGVLQLVYDGSFNPLTLTYTLSNLTTGYEYLFYVVAVNFNGDSSSSDALVSYACIAPSIPDPPYWISSTITTLVTSITLGWYTPSDYGGCALSGYRLWRDHGAGTSIIYEVDSLIIEGDPNLNEYEVTLATSD
jgi:hypothetical protein